MTTTKADLVIKPLVMSILTTYKCTSACRNCCFQCNPQRMEMLTVADMKKYIKDAIEAYDSIKVLVLTGGECLVYGRRLETIIRYATDLGLSVRVVTNGFWAKTYDKAYRKVEQLVAAGLKEINFSQYRR